MQNIGLNNSAVDDEQYVVFSLNDELFAVNVKFTREVSVMPSINVIPDSLPYMKGVFDLRGIIVPVLDLRVKFGMVEKIYDDSTTIIIVEIFNKLIGLIVDAVVDVMNISKNDIQNTPHFSNNTNRDSVIGIGRVNGRIIVIVDAEKIISKAELDGYLDESGE